MDEQNNKIIETLIVQAEQLIDIKNDTIKRITSLNDYLEQEKSNLEDYKIREESLIEEIVNETNDLDIINKDKNIFEDLEELIQFIQKEISEKKIENSKEFFSSDSNIINFNDHTEVRDVNNKRIDSLGWDLSLRTENCLKNSNIVSIGDLMSFGFQGLRLVPNLGNKNIQGIEKLLFDDFRLVLPYETAISENINKSDEGKSIEKVIFEVLDGTMTSWESAIMKYRYGLFYDVFVDDKFVEYNATDYGLKPGQHWDYTSCYYAQSGELKYNFQINIPKWSYTTTIKYINKALRKLKHPTRARRLKPFIFKAEKIAKSMGKELYNWENQNKDNIIYMSDIPECNNHYYAFICSIFGERFKA